MGFKKKQNSFYILVTILPSFVSYFQPLSILAQITFIYLDKYNYWIFQAVLTIQQNLPSSNLDHDNTHTHMHIYAHTHTQLFYTTDQS